MKSQFVKTIIIILSVFLTTSLSVYSEKFEFSFKNGEKYNLSIRSNIRVYTNDKYIGLNSKEMKGIQSVSILEDNNYLVQGFYYVMDKTMRNKINIGYKVKKEKPINFILQPNGNMKSTIDFPPLKSIPIFPDKTINYGDVFENLGIVNISLNENNESINNPVYVKTVYMGKKEFMGQSYDFFNIEYKYSNNDNSKTHINGEHKINYYFNNDSGMPVYMEDHFTEEIFFNKEKTKRIGFNLYFYKPIEKMDKEKLLENLEIIIDKNEDFTIQKKDDGIHINISNLQFKANSIELLTLEDRKKIDLIYKTLKSIDKRSFIITGHTASTGDSEAEMTLSTERAEYIANILIAKGIEAGRVIYYGKGSSEPIAPNDSEENMKKNRRVEITILED